MSFLIWSRMWSITMQRISGLPITQSTDPATKYAVLILFGPKLSPLRQMIVEVSQASWDGHPSVYAAVPATEDLIPDARVIPCRLTGWVSMLREAIIALKHAQPDIRYVFSYIEDHCPLQRVDHSLLDRFVQLSMAQQFKCVSFVTYPWPWAQTAPNSVDEVGRTMTWKHVDTVEIEGCRFARVPPDFFRYNQCQPSLWDIDYYASLCDKALEQGIDNPWTFEATMFEHQPQHYIADYRWPSVHHGFMAQGAVNPEAIRSIRADSAPTRRLRRYLLKTYLRDSTIRTALLDAFPMLRRIKGFLLKQWR